MQPTPPVGGTPLLPPSYLTAYFGFYFLFLCILYIYFYIRRRPLLIWPKIKLLLVLAAILKITLLAGIGLLAFYWLIPTPGVRRVIATNRVEVVFDRPVRRGVLQKSITPETPGEWIFENSIYTTHLYRNLVFYPTYSLRPNTTYTIKLTNIRNLLDVSPPYEYNYSFTTPPSPKINSVTPVSGQKGVDVNEKIKVTLDSPNNNVSDFDFQFTPHFEYDIELNSSKTTYTITPKKPLSEGITYNLRILKSDTILNLNDKSVVERGPATFAYNGNFTTSGAINSSSFFEPTGKILVSPENGWTAVSVRSPITVTFNEVFDRKSSENNFLITPTTDGVFSWNGNTLTFTPKTPLSFSTTYTVTNSSHDFKSVFTTQSATVKLDVPAYLQKYTLSCEASALRMALNYRGANVTEDDLLSKIGVDSTPHNGNIWGNPNNAFVGNVRGTQMVDGYGTYWDPIARAAKAYRNAEAFSNWSISDLTNALSDGNPVVIWVYSHFGTPTSWDTPDGAHIYAVRDEHAVVAVGFIGAASNPTQIIVNDPLNGQVYWSRASFNQKWDIFGRSGVVVY